MKARSAAAVALAALAIAAVGNAYVIANPPRCWHYWTVNASYLVLYNYGDRVYTIYVMTPSEYQVFNKGETSTAIGEWGLNPHSSLAIPLPSYGEYYVVASEGSCEQAATIRSYEGRGAPIGVSSFGPVRTAAVLGFFNITGISAYNPVGEGEFGVPNSGASLQLNAVLEAELLDGTAQYYWLQDVVLLITNSSKRYFVGDNIWNNTDKQGILSNFTIGGNGVVYLSDNDYYYAYGTPYESYSLPLAGYLLINITSTSPLKVQFCYAVVQNGTAYYPPVFDCYDAVTIRTPSPVVSAAIIAAPDRATPSDHLLDAELVFGGYARGEYTAFKALGADLALLYRDGDAWALFPNLYINGWDTAEAATNLVSSARPNGFVRVAVGPLPSGSTFMAKSLPYPPLPTTYVHYANTATGEEWGKYITRPITITAPAVVSGGQGVRHVLMGFNSGRQVRQR